ncbi:MAG: NAD(P)/FAD-dependent oxidoreductase [Pseudanabaenaceae cyanobacterium]|jgi:renalase
MKEVVVIGAGLAGLTCAQQLQQAGINVTVVEKSNGLGGRMATRRIQGTWIDHGAQYISPRDDGFVRFMRKLEEKQIVEPWGRNIYIATAQGLRPLQSDEIYPRYICTSGMTGIAKYIAQEFLSQGDQHKHRICNNTRIIGVQCDDQQWRLTTQNNEEITADAIVATMPAPQFLPLFESVLDNGSNFLQAVRLVKFLPNMTIMAGYDYSGVALPKWQGVKYEDDNILTWVSCNTSKHSSVQKQLVLVLQSSADFATQSMEEPDLEIAGKPMLIHAGKTLGKAFGSPEWWQVHRWRFAFADEPLGISCLSTASPLPLVCAGDWCAGRTIEAAYTSGMAAAESLAEML